MQLVIENHIPVLLYECIENLNIKPDGVYLDGTLGRAGHSFEIASKLTSGHLICVDKDETALIQGAERLSAFSDKVLFVHDDFRNSAKIIENAGFGPADGMLFDLGVSSPQLDDASRGFSYMQDSPLDMRMDTSSSFSAYDLINGFEEAELSRIFFEYGEERFSRRVASAIVRERTNKPVETTGELVEIIKSAMPASALREKQHPAKRIFQAVRIAVNDELGAVEEMISTAPDALASGGRLCVISFHSLEDRIVKNGIARRVNGCTCPREAPVCTCGFVQTLRHVTRKPIVPGEEELRENPRSRSAKLRVAERI
ncbi:MAG: 16S rRNA (cytosine(1402)-N(4))-methyltransferase RsmH [Eubacteriales bacterium]|nr:16S rRNA (cytosine(1402)-N(4))-methyltransferase RsmH [Eubacteriales bacterium]